MTLSWEQASYTSYTGSLTGTIGSAGSISGTLTDTKENTGTLYAAPRTEETSWQYSFTVSNALPGSTFLTPLTFTADSTGSLSWHINLVDSDFTSKPRTYVVSVCIHYAGESVFVSNNFTATVD